MAGSEVQTVCGPLLPGHKCGKTVFKKKKNDALEDRHTYGQGVHIVQDVMTTTCLAALKKIVSMFEDDDEDQGTVRVPLLDATCEKVVAPTRARAFVW